MADDTLTDEQWSVDYGRPFVIELADGTWLNMRSEGGIERAVREHNRVAAELRAARTRLSACERVCDDLAARFSAYGAVSRAIVADFRAALGVEAPDIGPSHAEIDESRAASGLPPIYGLGVDGD